MKILITGGSGLLGSAIAYLSTNKGYDTYAGYNLHLATEGMPTPIDITNRQMVEETFNKVKPDAVVHSAAMTHVDRCEENPELATLINVDGTRNIALEAEKRGAYLVYVSTDYVFSGEKGGYLETDEPHPINHYGATKLKGEEIVTHCKTHCITRPSVIYGSTPASGKENYVLWVIKQLKARQPIRIVNDQWVSPTLNTNLAEMILEVLERGLTGVYHLSGATPINRYDFTMKIAETFGLEKSLVHPITSSDMSWTARRPRDSTLNVDKAYATLSHKPMEVEAALKRLKDEMINNHVSG